jgi:hypothetical protein
MIAMYLAETGQVEDLYALHTSVSPTPRLLIQWLIWFIFAGLGLAFPLLLSVESSERAPSPFLLRSWRD